MLMRPVRILQVSRNINYPKEVHVGNNKYLVEKGFLGIHKETIYSSQFQRARDFDRIGIHFEYTGIFNIKGKMLEVEIKYYIRFGPLRDHLDLDVKFDGVVVGNYHALRSYCGGGANGSWPIIKNSNWQIVFNLELVENSEGENKFSIEYYENVFPSLTVTDNIKDVDSMRLARKIYLKEYSFDEIQQYKRTYWEISVIDSITGDHLGVLSYCEYVGFKKYHCSVYGSFEGDEWRRLRKDPWIGYSKAERWLTTVELNNPNGVEREILAGTCHMTTNKEKFKKLTGN